MKCELDEGRWVPESDIAIVHAPCEYAMVEVPLAQCEVSAPGETMDLVLSLEGGKGSPFAAAEVDGVELEETYARGQVRREGKYKE